jgi:hypothetical protein
MASSAWNALPWHPKHQELQWDHIDWGALSQTLFWNPILSLLYAFYFVYATQTQISFNVKFLVQILYVSLECDTFHLFTFLFRKHRNYGRGYKRGKEWTSGAQILRKNMKIKRATFTIKRHILICSARDWFEVQYTARRTSFWFWIFVVRVTCPTQCWRSFAVLKHFDNLGMAM